MEEVPLPALGLTSGPDLFQFLPLPWYQVARSPFSGHHSTSSTSLCPPFYFISTLMHTGMKTNQSGQEFLVQIRLSDRKH